jgi:uncharacterized protein
MNKERRVPESVTATELAEGAAKIVAAGESAPRAGRDPVNQPMIHNWVEALGDANPIYVDDEAARAAGHPGIVAPPAMAQVWTMQGLHGVRAADDPMNLANELFDAAGYTSVVATNCEQTYHRYVRPGEQVQVTSKLAEVKGPKRTGLGDGWFLTYATTWSVGDEVVTEMLFRLLKFAPGTAGSPAVADVPGGATGSTSSAAGVGTSAFAPEPAPEGRVSPVISRDTEFFWAGTEIGELRIQRLPDGSLRHPPIPALWQDKAEPTDYVVAAGTGTVFSFVVHHAPKVPGRDLPFVVALVELDEGVRVLGELRGIDPAEVAIDVPVRVAFEKLADGTVLPYWQAV